MNQKTNHKAIVLIHGFGGNHKEYQPIINFLKKQNFTKFYSFEYKENLGQISLADIALKLDNFIEKNINESEINIIGLSQGGIIARYYINFLSKKIVNNCITVCSPHHGSLLAYLIWFIGAKELRPQSNFLKKLNQAEKKQVKYFAVHNPLDLMVFPGTSAIFEEAIKNKKVLALAHPLTFWAKPTLSFILEILEEK